MTSPTVSFYHNLPVHQGTLADLYAKEDHFRSVPDDWQVILVDILGSTKAVERGLHYEVNLAATGSIITVHKIVRHLFAQIEIPYFFGGDGATFLLPGSACPPVLEALEKYRHHTKQTTGLVLRVGSVAVRSVYEENCSIRVARFRLSDKLVLPIVLGLGIKRSERHIKEAFIEHPQAEAPLEDIDLSGMECRWEEIPPPEPENRIVCLLADCPDETRQRIVFQKIAVKLIELFGGYQVRQPVSKPRLRLTTSLRSIRREMLQRLGYNSKKYLFKHWINTLFGPLYFKFSEEGKAYFESIPALSHTMMMDGTFNTVFSGKPDKIQAFTEFLNDLEQKEPLIYGLHITHGSIMCCYVEDRKAQHQHFVDGTEGGYTSASRMFKEKRDSKKGDA